jgi:transcriptional regulator PpsR
VPIDMSIAQPDVTLRLDLDGVIRSAELSETFVNEEVEGWVGRPWVETVADVGGDKIRRMLDDAREQGVSAFSQVNQRFSSGLELPMEFTTVMLGGKAGLVAVGKNLLAVAELQSRLISAQQAMERDYWKLREVETRYRLLFDASNEAVLLLRAADLQVVEANPAAIRALGLSPVGRGFLAELTARDREAFQAMLARVREQGKAPGIMVHLGSQQEPWLIRASLITGEPGALFLLQLSAVGAVATAGQNDPL